MSHVPSADVAFPLPVLQLACQAIPDQPDAIAHLDPDTTVSHHTFHVALRAASSVCVAIDKVVSGEVSNAFCAVRPPGHHAGPRGIVPSKKDRTGSHGFCLLNNVAIGAAYAMNVHRWAPLLVDNCTLIRSSVSVTQQLGTMLLLHADLHSARQALLY